jgi:uridylate kinase
MDSTAMTLCRDNKLTTHIFGMTEDQAVSRALRAEQFGTIVYS